MDLRIKLSLFALMVLGSLAVVSAQIDCYSCSYTYTDDENENDNSNCKNPTSALTFSRTCGSSQSCYVESTFSSFSSVSSPGRITFTRGCSDTEDCHTTCTKDPRNCRKCCTTANCNTDTLMTHLTDNALTQTCYRCQYSEVPGTRSDTGCGLAFDAASAGVYEAQCPGLCYSARARFEDVEDIIRGCLYHGNSCSYDGIKDSGGNPASLENGRDQVTYDIACCNGDKCNTANALSVGIVSVLMSTLLGTIVTQL